MAEIEENDKPGIFFYIFFVALPIAMGLLLIYLVLGLAFCIYKENKSQWNKEPAEEEATYTIERVVSYVKENEIPVYLDGETIDIDSVDLKYYDWSFNDEKNILRLHARNQSPVVIPVPIFI